MVDEIVIGLEDVAVCTPWPMAFPITKNTLESLLKAFRKHDMAIFVFSPDDDAVIRGQSHKVVRDNVLFEAGMFMGMQGDDRTFIVSPRDIDFHTATDLIGITTAVYEPDQVKRDITGGLSGCIARIRKAIKATASATQRLSIVKTPAQLGASTLTFPLKISLKVANNQSARVLVQANGFEFGKGIRCHPKASVRGDGRYDFKFYEGLDPISKKEIWVTERFLEPGQETTTWIPVDESTTDEAALKEHYRNNTAGVLHYRTIWLGEVPITQVNEDRV